jgi:hypothetical protein
VEKLKIDCVDSRSPRIGKLAVMDASHHYCSLLPSSMSVSLASLLDWNLKQGWEGISCCLYF